jgi:hypothetical protein
VRKRERVSNEEEDSMIRERGNRGLILDLMGHFNLLCAIDENVVLVV